MVYKRNICFTILDWFRLPAFLITVVSVVCVIPHGPASAAADSQPGQSRIMPVRQPGGGNEQDQRLRRSFPREAMEACDGKKEGDSCTVRTPQGLREGICLSGVQNMFACRPGRSPQQETPAASQSQPLAEPVQRTVPEPRSEPRGVSQPETAQPPKSSSEPIKPPESATTPPPVNPSSPQGSQLQTGLSSPVESPLPPPPIPNSGVYDMPGRYAGHLDSYLAVALLAAGLAWYASFRYSTIPLRRLRKVTQLLAGGNLSARVGEGLIFRKNEVADLGRDVDRMAERIESLVGAHQRLIRDVSHELRSPLARLNVALELARQSAGAGHAAPFDRIERESDRLNELIGQLLMLTKLENESGTVQRTELDIAALITEISQDVDFEAKSNHRRVETASCESLMLNGNKELLRQAIENLVRNAVRYTETGTTVEISLRKKETGGRGWAHIEVRDYGPGVPESELYDIFRPFYRVNDARERKSGGTGVGLAISDRAVRLHGGSLRAFNAPGVGLIMELELPMGQQ